MSSGLDYNVEHLYELADELSSKIKEFDSQIDAMYTSIDTTLNSPDYWQGAAYDAFKNNCDSYRTSSILPLIQTLQGWVDSINDAAVEADENTNKNVNLFD